MLLVPCLQFLELRVLGERGHGVSGWEHGPGRAPIGKRGEQRTTGGETRCAASFMAQAPGPATPLAPPRPAPPSAPRGNQAHSRGSGTSALLSLLTGSRLDCCYSASLCLELIGEQRPSSCLLH